MTQTETTATESPVGKWKPYPAYKDSEVEWLDKIPVHWLIKPIKHIACFINGAPFKPSDWGEVGTPIIRIENLNGGNEFNRTTLKIDAKYCVEKGDLLFGWSGNRGTSFGPFIWNHEGAYYLNQHIFRIEDFIEDRKWLYWLLKGVTTYVESQAHGIIGLVHITKQDLGSIQAPIIPETEQHAIATFLDYETARINTLVAKKERLIELLQEKRASLISHVVTRGLEPTVPMKDSGVEWLGEIPTHWEVWRLKHFTHVVSKGTTPTTIGKVFLDEGIRFIKAENISNGRVANEPATFIDASTNEFLKRSILYAYDVLMVIAGATTGKVGIIDYNQLPANTNQAVAFIRQKDPNYARFLLFWLGSHKIQEQVWLKAVQAAQPNLSLDDIRNFMIPVPPKSEVIEIIKHLDQETSKIDALVSRIREGIGKLKEYSTALISAAVTGKIDVRGKITLPDHGDL
jgi:type I restriction enzyme S subunit